MWGRKAKVGRMSYLLFCLSTTNKRHSLFFSIESLFFYVQAEKNKQTKKKEESYKMYGEKQADSALQPFYHLLFFM